MLEHDVDVNVEHQSTKETALHFAAKSGHVQCVEILLSHKANPCIRNKKGYLPEDIAMNYGYHALSLLLKSSYEGQNFVYQQ